MTSAGGELPVVDTPRLPHAGAAAIVVALPHEIDSDNADRVGEDLAACTASELGTRA